jgi:hypothetical protein
VIRRVQEEERPGIAEDIQVWLKAGLLRISEIAAPPSILQDRQAVCVPAENRGAQRTLVDWVF